MMNRKFIFLFLFPLSLQAAVFEDVKSHTQTTVVDAFDKQGLWILGTGTLAVIISRQFDNQTRDSWKDHHFMDPQVTKVGEFWGGGIPEAVAFGVQLYYDKNNAIPGIEGVILGNLAVQGLKYSVR